MRVLRIFSYYYPLLDLYSWIVGIPKKTIFFALVLVRGLFWGVVSSSSLNKIINIFLQVTAKIVFLKSIGMLLRRNSFNCFSIVCHEKIRSDKGAARLWCCYIRDFVRIVSLSYYIRVTLRLIGIIFHHFHVRIFIHIWK